MARLSDEARLEGAQKILHYHFADSTLLENALTHSSAKSAERPSNERLEFLGDAVLGLVISDFLYLNFPERAEGELTKVKSVVVSTKTLAAEIQRLKLDELIDVSWGIQKSNTISEAMCADLFEAIVGAIYLDGGIEVARWWILEVLEKKIEGASLGRVTKNWKSRLQQHTQKHLATVPRYVLDEASGPDHQPCFAISVWIGETLYGKGEGPTKKSAEQLAAEAACQKLEEEEATAESSEEATVSNDKIEEVSRPEDAPKTEA